MEASSTSDETKRWLSGIVTPGMKVMVILDSDHSAPHVLEELRFYHRLVSMGSYLIVEDTNLSGNPVVPEFGPGPMDALESFLAENDEFVSDGAREKFFFLKTPRAISSG